MKAATKKLWKEKIVFHSIFRKMIFSQLRSHFGKVKNQNHNLNREIENGKEILTGGSSPVKWFCVKLNYDLQKAVGLNKVQIYDL